MIEGVAGEAPQQISRPNTRSPGRPSRPGRNKEHTSGSSGRASPDRMEVRPATAKDVPVAAEILEDAIAWAGRRGLESWTSGAFANPDGWGRTKLVEAVESGGLYLILVGAEVVGTMSLLPEDPEFWPDSPPDALYLHRFAVRAGHSGRGVGAAAMAWADAEARRRGRRFLRLDCLAGNAGIRTYYERAGFRHRDDIEVRGIRFALYEREAREGTRTTLESS